MKVKICGITRLEDALYAADQGVDMLGFNFYVKSPRYIGMEKAAQICADLQRRLAGDCPITVGIFVNSKADEIGRILDETGVEYAQLSGDEPSSLLGDLNNRAFKSVRPASVEQALEQISTYVQSDVDSRVPSILVDAYHPNLYGGTGEQANTGLAIAVRDRVPRMMLAGGLTPENVAERVRSIGPWGVDVASGVEDGQPGVKSHERIRLFVQAVRSHER